MKCAICSKTFSIKSLVTAHKKKRSECTENERIDPRIVWPLCKFGCDYLYEERCIIVRNGKTVANNTESLKKSEWEIVKGLENREISEDWLYKSEMYFE